MNLRCVLALALCAASIAGGVDAHYVYRIYQSYNDKPCQAPKEGQWEIEHYFQASRFDPEVLPYESKSDDLVLTLVATVTITSSAENIYNGTGVAEEFVPQKANNVPVQFMAIFDPKSCVLSGTEFSHPDSRAATFRWKVSEATEMHGIYVPTIDGVSGALLTGTQSATFLG